MSWEVAETLANKAQGGLFVRMANDGDKVVGAFCGEPYAREVVWTGTKYEDFDPVLHEGERPSVRIALNFFDPADGAMKVFEMSPTTFRDVLKVRNKYGLDKWVFEIERRGTGPSETKYHVLPETRIEDDLAEKIKAAELNNLQALCGGGAGSGEVVVDKAASPEDLAEITDKLRALEPAQVKSFLGELGVSKVKDIGAGKVLQAKALLAKLGADADDTDPFAD